MPLPRPASDPSPAAVLDRLWERADPAVLLRPLTTPLPAAQLERTRTVVLEDILDELRRIREHMDAAARERLFAELARLTKEARHG